MTCGVNIWLVFKNMYKYVIWIQPWIQEYYYITITTMEYLFGLHNTVKILKQRTSNVILNASSHKTTNKESSRDILRSDIPVRLYFQITTWKITPSPLFLNILFPLEVSYVRAEVKVFSR